MTSTPSVVDWAERIRPHLISVAEGIIAAGRELLAAKAALPHGEFGPLLDELGLTPRTAQRFMAIARDPVLSDATRVSQLPGAWGTLYELTRLPADVLVAAIDSGEVSPATRREDVRALFASREIDQRPVDCVDPRIVAVQNAVAWLGAAMSVAEDHPDSVSVEHLRRIRDQASQARDIARSVTEEYEAKLAQLLHGRAQQEA